METVIDICDDCSLVAYDNGINGWDNQVQFMGESRKDIYDHECTAKIEPDLNINCHCGCRR